MVRQIARQSLDQFSSTGIAGVKTAAEPKVLRSVRPSRHTLRMTPDVGASTK
jgi:hypothetical protein